VIRKIFSETSSNICGLSLSVDLANVERDFQIKRADMKAEYDQELFKLKQENCALSSKVCLLMFIHDK